DRGCGDHRHRCADGHAQGAVGAVHHRSRVEPGHARRDGRQRRARPDRDRARRGLRRAAVDGQRLHADAGGVHPPRGLAERPVRAAAGLRRGGLLVRRRVAAVRAGDERRDAHRRPCPAGRRRSAPDARKPRDHLGDLPRGRSIGRGGGVVGAGRRGGRPGAVPRRMARGVELAGHLPAQPADRDPDRRGGRPSCPGVARPVSRAAPGLGGDGPGRDRTRPGDLRPDVRGRRRESGGVDLRYRRRRGAARVRRRRTAVGPPPRPAGALPEPAVHRRERCDAAGLRGPRGRLRAAGAAVAGRRRSLAPLGRHLPAARHPAHAGVLGPRRCARPPHRSPAAAHGGSARGGERPAGPRVPRRGRRLRAGRAAGGAPVRRRDDPAGGAPHRHRPGLRGRPLRRRRVGGEQRRRPVRRAPRRRRRAGGRRHRRSRLHRSCRVLGRLSRGDAHLRGPARGRRRAVRRVHPTAPEWPTGRAHQDRGELLVRRPRSAVAPAAAREI
ncbi:MAG: Uncharacterized MFS-type transporter, partial [uncultured Blastococcus sp.]